MTFYCKIFFMLFWMSLSNALSAQFAGAFGGPGGDEIVDVKVCSSAIFVAGFFQQNLDTAISKGGFDAFLRSYDVQGNLIWQYTIGGSDNDFITAIESSNDTCLYAVGSYTGALMFGNNDTTIFSQNKAIFISKFDNDGQLKWVRSILGSALVSVNDILVDAQQNLYLCGAFQDTLFFEQPYLLEGNLQNQAYLFSLNADGNTRWVQTADFTYIADATALTQDSLGHLFLAGVFNGLCSWRSDTMQAHPIFTDIYLTKWDSSGQFYWQKQFGGAYNNEVTSLQYHNKHLYMAGQFKGNLGIDTLQLNTPFRDYDAFIAKLDSSGKAIWATQSTNEADCFLQDLIVSDHQITACGYFNAYFLWENQTALSVDQTDAFVFALDLDNTQHRLIQLGGDAFELANSVAFMDDGTLLVAGGFQQNLQLVDTILLADGFSDAFLVQLAPFVLNSNHIQADNPDFRVGPVPFEQHLTIFCETCTNLHWLLLDMQGKVLKSGSTLHIETSEYPAGIYYLQLHLNQKKYIVKVVHR